MFEFLFCIFCIFVFNFHVLCLNLDLCFVFVIVGFNFQRKNHSKEHKILKSQKTKKTNPK